MNNFRSAMFFWTAFHLIISYAVDIEIYGKARTDHNDTNDILLELQKNSAFIGRDVNSYYLSTPLIGVSGEDTTTLGVYNERWQSSLLEASTVVQVLAYELMQRGVKFISHFSAIKWHYDESTNELKHQDTGLCLTADPLTMELHLSVCDRSKLNQYFVYNSNSSQLLWVNPDTKICHFVYLQSDAYAYVFGKPMLRALISRNPVYDPAIRKLRQRNELLTLFSLKQRQFKDSTSQQTQKFIEDIHLLKIGRKDFDLDFDYFKNKGDMYLLSDGYSVTSVAGKELDNVNFKYNGLWKITETGHLMHYLNNKYLSAVPAEQSPGIKKLKKAYPGIADIDSAHYYDLKLCTYNSAANETFITVDQKGLNGMKYQMYINNAGSSRKVEKMMILSGIELFLVFDGEEIASQFAQHFS